MAKIREKLRCPECRSLRLIKFGFKHRRDRVSGNMKPVQRYLCKKCGRTTVNPLISKGRK